MLYTREQMHKRKAILEKYSITDQLHAIRKAILHNDKTELKQQHEDIQHIIENLEYEDK